MKITLNPAVSAARNVNYPQNQQSQKTQNATTPTMQKYPQQIAFKGWFDDVTYYFAKKLDDKREKTKQAQFDQVRMAINDDIKFMAERQGISLEAAKARYEDNFNAITIPLKYNGYEEGLNKVVGYSLEKYKAMTDLVLPLMASTEKMSKEYPVPNGMLLYGPAYTGKTHFANALGEHIKLKSAGEFMAYKIDQKDEANDNAVPLLEFFENAEARFQTTNKRQVLFFDDTHLLLDEEKPNIRGVLLAKMANCAQNGVTWVGTVNDPTWLPEMVLKPTRLNSDIYINKMSDGEKSAVMSYFWTRRDRQDGSDHNAILNANKYNGFHFYPPKVKDVSIRVDNDLRQNADRDSRLNSSVTVRKPVETADVNKGITKFRADEKLKKRDLDEAEAIYADKYLEYVQRKRGKYADKK